MESLVARVVKMEGELAERDARICALEKALEKAEATLMIPGDASRRAAAVDGTQGGGDTTLTAGKHSFHDLYDAPDAAPYMCEMHAVGYTIGDHTAAVASRALGSILGNPASPALPPVLLELCAG
jgi:hypothetical protein